MGCNTESKTINDREYSVTQWPAQKAMVNKFKLAKAFGPALTTMIGSTGEGLTEEQEANKLSNGLASLFQSNSPEELVELITSCVIGTACDGARITDSSFTTLYSGDNLSEAYRVFIFVLQVNYSNLFKGQLVDNLLAKAKALV